MPPAPDRASQNLSAAIRSYESPRGWTRCRRSPECVDCQSSCRSSCRGSLHHIHWELEYEGGAAPFSRTLGLYGSAEILGGDGGTVKAKAMSGISRRKTLNK